MTNIITNQNAKPATFETAVSEIFKNNLSKFFDDDSWPGSSLKSQNHVPVNVHETENAYELHVFAPGLRKEDFQLNISGELLTISCNKEMENDRMDEKRRLLRQEYRLSSFVRSFTCDDTIDTGKVSAKYESGILLLTLPKKEGNRNVTHSIAVQ